MSREEMSMEAVQAELRSIRESLKNQDDRYDERRKQDDERERVASSERRDVLARVDAHGRRTTQLETKWEAFFGDQGAFKIFTKKLDQHDSKIDKQMWLTAIGVGIIVATEFFLKK